LDAIMQKMDLDINGTIEFEEFLAGLRHLRWLIDDPHQTKSAPQNQPRSSSSISSSSSSPSSSSAISCGKCEYKNTKYLEYQIGITEKFLSSLKTTGGFLSSEISEDDASILLQFNDMLNRINGTFHI